MAVARKNVSKVEKKKSELTSGSEGSEKRNFPIITRNAISFFFLDIVRVYCSKFTEFQRENFLLVV